MRRVTAWVGRHPDASAALALFLTPFAVHAPAFLINGAAGGTSRVTIREHGPHLVRLETEAEAAAYLVLTDTWFPGWRARVDGADQPIWRADHALRAITLGPGRHEVEFRYEPGSVRLGLALTASAGLLAVGLAVLPRCRKRLP